MRGRLSRVLRVVALAAVVTLAPGCVAIALVAGAAAAYGVVKYTDNEAVAEYGHDADAVWEAALLSLERNGYPVSQDVDRVSAGSEVSINDIELHVLPVSADLTRVTVRAGTFSTDEHKARSSAVLHEISDVLD